MSGQSRLVLSCRSFLLLCLGAFDCEFNSKLQLGVGWLAGAEMLRRGCDMSLVRGRMITTGFAIGIVLRTCPAGGSVIL